LRRPSSAQAALPRTSSAASSLRVPASTAAAITRPTSAGAVASRGTTRAAVSAAVSMTTATRRRPEPPLQSSLDELAQLFLLPRHGGKVATLRNGREMYSWAGGRSMEVE